MRRCLPYLPLAVLLVLTSSLAGCGRTGTADLEGWNCLLVTIDTVRQDRIGIYGYEKARTPRLDDLGARGIVFDHAVAATPTTLPSHASILTGTHPPFHGVRGNAFYTLPEERESIAEILAAAGYQTAAVIGASVLDHRFGLAQGFARFDDDPKAMKSDSEHDPSRPASQVTLAALRAARDFRDDAPWFIWAHYYDAHLPRTPRPAFTPPAANPLDPDIAYDAEIAFMDYYIGILIDRLDEMQKMEKTLIVVIADHGEGIGGPHVEQTHGMFLYRDTQRVSLIAFANGGIAPGRRSARLVQQIDVAPTILDLLGFEIGDEMQGTSFRAAIEGRKGEPAPPSYSETMLPWESYGWSPLFQTRDARWKYIRGPYDELYDLENDPDELTNVATRHPETVAQMREHLDEVLRDQPSGSALGVGLVQDPEELRRLEALGYVIGGRGGDDLPDLPTLRHPLDMYSVIERLDEVTALEASDQISRAIRILRDLRREDPDNYDVLRRIAQLEMRQSQWSNATDAARRLIEIRPDLPHSFYLLADVLAARGRQASRLGRESEGRAWLDEAVETLRSIPDSDGILGASPATRLGQLLQEIGREDEALLQFERAIEIHPDHYTANRLAGEIRHKRGDSEAALRYLEVAATSAVDDPERLPTVLARLMTIYQENGDREKARAAAQVFVKRFPDDPATKLAEHVLRQLDAPR